MANNHHLSQSGNAFWIILLCIALLVSLTIAVTRSSESTEETGTRDRSRIIATDILRQARGMQQAVDQLRMGGVAENQVSFDNPVVSGYANTLCGDSALATDDDPCGLFKARGTGLSYKTPLNDWLDKALADAPLVQPPLYGEWYWFASACIPGVGTGGAACNTGASATELIVAMPYTTRDICLEINRLAGVPNPPRAPATIPEPPLAAATVYPAGQTKYTGTFSAGAILDTAGSDLTGHPTGCFESSEDANTGRPDYHIYHTLIAR